MELLGPPAVDDSTVKEDLAMRVDYHKVFPGGMRAMAELERAVHVLSLDGLDLPDCAGPGSASGSA
jgi:hypothetical protein